MSLLRRVFGAAVEPGEEGAVSLLLAQSMGMGVFRSFFLATASAQFLSQFEVSYAPVAYIVAGGVGYVSVALFSYFRRRLPLPLLLFGTLAFVLSLVLLFRLSFNLSESRWLGFALFVCIGPIATLLDLVFGGLSGRLFDLQQSKRLLSLVGSGEAAASILGFFMVPVLLTFVENTLTLLLFAAGGIAFCLLILVLIQSRLGEQLKSATPAKAAGANDDAGEVSKRYFLFMALGTAALILSHYFIDFAFLSQTKSQFGDREAIGSFMGLFFGVARSAELLSKVFLANWLIRQFGLGAGLLTLPAALLVCAGLAALSGSLLGTATAAFFLLVAGSRFIMFVLRKSLFDPSSRVLYQPLPAGERFAMETRVGGTVRQLAMIAAGGALLLLNLFPGFSVVLVMYALVALLAGWVLVSRQVFSEYRVRLIEMLRSLPKRALVTPPADIVRDQLLTATPAEVQFSINVLERVDPEMLEGIAIDLADSAEPRVREVALREIAYQRLDATPLVTRLAAADPDEKVRAVASHVQEVLEQKTALEAEPESLAELAASSDYRERRLAAQVLADVTTAGDDDLLFTLLWDKEAPVRHAAIAAAGRQGNEGYWPRLIDQVASGQFSNTAIAALAEVGEPVFDELEVAFRRFGEQPIVLGRLLKVFERVGGKRAESFLLGNIAYPAREVQRQALFSLGVLGYQASASEVSLIKARVESIVDSVAWYSAAHADLSGEEDMDDLHHALEVGVKTRRARIFLLLAFICDGQTVRLLQDHAGSESSEDRAYALEIAEQALPEELAELLFPILEGLTPAATHERLAILFPHPRLSRTERMRDLIRQGNDRIDHWTRACGLASLSEDEAIAAHDELIGNFFSPNLMVAELAGLWLSRVSHADYETRWPQLPSETRDRLRGLVDSASDSLAGYEAGEYRVLSVYERVRLLRDTPIFAEIPESILAEAAARASQTRVEAGTVLFRDGDPGRTVFVVVSGRIRIEKDGVVLTHVEPGKLLGEIAAVERGPRTASAIIEEDGSLLGLDQEMLFQLMADHPTLIPGMVEVIARRRARG